MHNSGWDTYVKYEVVLVHCEVFLGSASYYLILFYNFYFV